MPDNGDSETTADGDESDGGDSTGHEELLKLSVLVTTISEIPAFECMFRYSVPSLF